jgi:hypothetical protein
MTAPERRPAVATSRLRIGQTIERARDHTRGQIFQIHRADRLVEVDDGSARRVSVTFTNLRRYWREIS